MRKHWFRWRNEHFRRRRRHITSLIPLTRMGFSSEKGQTCRKSQSRLPRSCQENSHDSLHITVHGARVLAGGGNGNLGSIVSTVAADVTSVDRRGQAEQRWLRDAGSGGGEDSCREYCDRCSYTAAKATSHFHPRTHRSPLSDANTRHHTFVRKRENSRSIANSRSLSP